MSVSKIKKRGSLKARKSAARLVAAQAVYQYLLRERDAMEIVEEFFASHLNQTIDGEDLITADAEMLSKLVQGVALRQEDIESLVAGQLPEGKLQSTDLLLKAVMFLGAYELLEHTEIDSPIIVNDYVNVCKAFYEKEQASLVNAVLDKISKITRS